MRDELRADRRLQGAERAQRHHAAGGIADIEPVEIRRRRPRILVGLQRDAEGAPEQVEVVHIERPQEYLQGIEDVRHIEPEQFCLGTIEIVFELRG